MKKYYRADGTGIIPDHMKHFSTGKHSQQNGILVLKTFAKYVCEREGERESWRTEKNRILYNTIA